MGLIGLSLAKGSMKQKTTGANQEILDYIDGQMVVDFLEHPDNQSGYFHEEDIDILVPGRTEWTAATLAILARCNILKEDFDGQKSRYRLQQNIINGTNNRMRTDVQRFFMGHPSAHISTVFLCKKFLSNIFQMRDILFDYKYDGLIDEITRDYYCLSKKYISLLPNVTKLSDKLFGPPIEIPKDCVAKQRKNPFMRIL